MRSFDITYFHSDFVEIIYSKNTCFSYPEHNHCSIYTLAFLLAGKIMLKRKNSVLTVDENHFFVIPPYEPHALISHGEYEMLTLCIKKEFVKSLDLTGLTAEINRRLYPLIIQGTLPYTISRQVVSAMNEVAVLMNEPFVSGRANIEWVKDMIERSPENPLEIKRFAGLISMSEYHFIREFKRVVGLAPHKFQIQNRVRKAQRLLTQDIPLTEVALAAGFYDQSHFIRHFKRAVGLAPGDYRSACTEDIHSIGVCS